MRRTDLVARYGGEEFVVLMPATPQAAALARIEALRQALTAEPIALGDGSEFRINFSAGVAGIPQDAEATSPKLLLQAADTRLLMAKRAGRGRCMGRETAEAGEASPGPGSREAPGR